MTDEQIIAIADGLGFPSDDNEAITFARALFAASIADTAGAKPDGWKLVPIEPTEAMVRAACLKQSNAAFESYEAWHDSHSSGISARIRQLVARDYRVMIDNAPPAPSVADDLRLTDYEARAIYTAGIAAGESSVADARPLSDERIAKAWFGEEYGPGHTRAPGYVYTFLAALNGPEVSSVADAAGASEGKEVATAVQIMNSQRFEWITHDHDDRQAREDVRRIVENMSVKSYSAMCRDIDESIKAWVLRENSASRSKCCFCNAWMDGKHENDCPQGESDAAIAKGVRQ